MENNVLSKLYKGEAIQVELANINDLTKLIASGEKIYKSFNDAYAEIEKMKSVVVAYGEQYASIIENASSVQMTLKKQFQELGLNWDEYPEAKAFKNLIARSQTMGKMTTSVKNIM